MHLGAWLVHTGAGLRFSPPGGGAKVTCGLQWVQKVPLKTSPDEEHFPPFRTSVTADTCPHPSGMCGIPQPRAWPHNGGRHLASLRHSDRRAAYEHSQSPPSIPDCVWGSSRATPTYERAFGERDASPGLPSRTPRPHVPTTFGKLTLRPDQVSERQRSVIDQRN